MSDWLTKRRPPAGPAAPAHVDHGMLLEAIAERMKLGLATPAELLMRDLAPPQQLDKWGQPLPLSAFDQERLDQLFGLLSSPYDRGKALLHAGMLTPQETDALLQVFPEIFSVLMDETVKDMKANPPPYAAWAETTLGIFFGMPVYEVWNQGQPKAPDRTESLQGKPKKGTEADVPSTPSERREVAVREMRS